MKWTSLFTLFKMFHVLAFASMAVADTTPPVITLVGSSTVFTEARTTYVEEGAFCLDNIDGLLPTSTSSTVNTNILGDYNVTHSCVDSSGNVADINRTVIVSDTIPPVLSLVGSSIVFTEARTTYADLGATCVDDFDGDLTVSTIDAVDTSKLGDYNVTYSCVDSSGNPAVNVVRAVKVVDTTPPVISLNGSSIVFTEARTTYADLGATCEDSVDEDPIITTISTVSTNILGDYAVAYSCVDSSGNHAHTVTRAVTVIDRTPPVLSLVGSDTVNTEASTEATTTYSDLGATCEDSVDGDLSDKVSTTNTVNTNILGDYYVSYVCSDSSGNPALAVRRVTVVDSTPPVISLNGPSTVSTEAATSYSDFGATCMDSFDGARHVSAIGTVNTNILGDYLMTFSCVDSSGNSAVNVDRTVTVVDTIPPVLSLNGPSTVLTEAATTYSDPKASCVDGVDGSLPVSTSSTVNTNILGSYSVTYTCSDSSGNAATGVVRTVTVKDTTPPVISLNGPSTVSTEVRTSYSDLGATCKDSFDGELTVSTSSTVNTDIPGSYSVIYTCSDSSGNDAVVVRTVTVVDCEQLKTKYVSDCGCNGDRKDICNSLESTYRSHCSCE